MENKNRIVRKRTKLRKRSFFKRKIKVIDTTYLDILIYIIVVLIFIIGIFHKVIYSYFSAYWE